MNGSEKYSGVMYRYFLPLMLFIVLTLILFPEYVSGKMTPFGRDDAITYQPQRYFFAENLAEGNIPLWCPNIGFGHPMAAEGQNTFLHPFTFLFLILPFLHAYSLSIVMCYPFFAFFLYLLCLEWGLKREGSILTAILVTFAGAFLLWQGHYAIISTLVWVPLFLMFLIRACRRGRFTDILLASLFHVLMIFSGAAQFTYASTIFAFIFLLSIGDSGQRFSLIAVLKNFLPVIILSALLGAVQLIPLYELTMHSQRSGALFDPNSGALNIRTLSALGSPLLITPKEILNGDTALYGSVGFLGTLLALFGYFHADGKIRRAIPIILFIIFAFGGWTTLGLFREAGRMLFFAGLIIGLHAGLGLDTFLAEHSYEKKFKRSFIYASIALILLTLFSTDFFPVNSIGGYLLLLIPPLFVIIILRLLKLPAGKLRLLTTTFVILISLAGSVFALHLKTSETAVESEILSATPDVVSEFEKLNPDGRVWISIIGREDSSPRFHDAVYGPRALMYGFETTDHETPLFIDGILPFERALMKSITSKPYDSSGRIPSADILAGLEYIAVPSDTTLENPYLSLVYPESKFLEEPCETDFPFLIWRLNNYRGKAFFIFPEKVEYVSEDAPLDISGFTLSKNNSVPKLMIYGPEAEISKTPKDATASTYHPDNDPDLLTIEYSAPPGSFLFISQTFYPGWKAYIDDEEVPLYKTCGLFSGVVVDDPEGVVELRYEPSTWKLGANVSKATLVILLSLYILWWKKFSRRLSPAHPA